MSKTIKAEDQSLLLENLEEYKELEDNEMEEICAKAGILDDLSEWREEGGYAVWKSTALKSDGDGLYLHIVCALGDETNGDESDFNITVRTENREFRYSF